MAEERDIYAAPASAVATEDARVGGLASRVRRLIAAIIDGILILMCSVPFWVFIGPAGAITGTTTMSLGSQVMGVVYFAVLFLLINGYLLNKSGQTVGKYLLGIKIVALDGTLVALQRLVLYRYLPIWLVGIIPLLGQIIPFGDILFIFRSDRRCIHDLLAGTTVVDA